MGIWEQWSRMLPLLFLSVAGYPLLGFRMRKPGFQMTLPVLAVLVLGIFSASAQDRVSIEFPLRNAAEPTGWHFLRAADSRGIAIDIKPPNTFQHLLVTVVFDEHQAQQLSAVWLSEDGPDWAVVGNFIEGTGQANQGVFVLHQAILGNGGTLVFKGDSQALAGVRRIRLAWADTLTIYGNNPAEAPSLFQEGGKAFLPADLAGAPWDESGDHYEEGVVRASLTDQLTPLARGVAFMAPLSSGVERVRFEAKITGLPPDAELAVSVNGYPSQALPVETPSLHDPGYLAKDGKLIYAGWRKAAIILPAAAMRVGENYVVIEPDPNAPDAMLKDAALEVVFGDALQTTEIPRMPEVDPSAVEEEPNVSDSTPRFRFSVP